MPEFVRVRRPEDGTEFSIVKSALAVWPDLIVLDDKPATRADGTPIRTKHRTKPRAEKRASADDQGRKADTSGRQASNPKEQ